MRVFGLFIFSLFIFGGFSPALEDQVILTTKVFNVRGSTSIGKYNCDYKLDAKDTLFLNQRKGLNYKIPVKQFGCGNFLLTGDFRKTLNAKDYPYVYIELRNVRKSGQGYKYDLHLQIAGKNKDFRDLVLNSYGKTSNGKIDLNFSDFNLTPPKKLGGAIKVKEEINLEITLNTAL